MEEKKDFPELNNQLETGETRINFISNMPYLKLEGNESVRDIRTVTGKKKKKANKTKERKEK